MGINSRSLTPEARRAAGITLMGNGWRPKLAAAIAGAVVMTFKGDPPATTHQAKKLAPRGNWKNGRGRMALVNSPKLEAAHEYYRAQIPPRGLLVPLAPPIIAHVVFWFEPTRPGDPAQRYGMPHTEKPDRDNAAKVLFDELTLAGYLIDDSQIFDGPIAKRWSGRPDSGRVEVYLRSWLGHLDDGWPLMRPPSAAEWVVHPLPLQPPPPAEVNGSSYPRFEDQRHREAQLVEQIRTLAAENEANGATPPRRVNGHAPPSAILPRQGQTAPGANGAATPPAAARQQPNGHPTGNGPIHRPTRQNRSYAEV